MLFGSDVSIAIEQESISMIFHSVENMPLLNWIMYDVRRNESIAWLSTILKHVHACRSPTHTCSI